MSEKPDLNSEPTATSDSYAASDFPKRLRIQTKAHRYRVVVTIETGTELPDLLKHVTVDAPEDSTVTKTLVPVEGDTIAHSFPSVAFGAAENPFHVVAEIIEA